MDLRAFSEETKQQAQVFDRIGDEYEKVFGTNTTQIFAVNWLIKRLKRQAHVLDLGCGTGVPAAKMLSEAGLKVQGIDISSEMLKIAKTKAPLAQFKLMDIAQIDFIPEKVNAVVAFFSLLMLRKSIAIATINKLNKILLSKGFLLFSMIEGDVDYAEVPFLKKTRVRISTYQKEELIEILESAKFKILEVKTVTYTPSLNINPEKQLFFFCQLTK